MEWSVRFCPVKFYEGYKIGWVLRQLNEILRRALGRVGRGGAADVMGRGDWFIGAAGFGGGPCRTPAARVCRHTRAGPGRFGRSGQIWGIPPNLPNLPNLPGSAGTRAGCHAFHLRSPRSPKSRIAATSPSDRVRPPVARLTTVEPAREIRHESRLGGRELANPVHALRTEMADGRDVPIVWRRRAASPGRPRRAETSRTVAPVRAPQSRPAAPSERRASWACASPPCDSRRLHSSDAPPNARSGPRQNQDRGSAERIRTNLRLPHHATPNSHGPSARPEREPSTASEEMIVIVAPLRLARSFPSLASLAAS
jgi:hypothetical protein